MPLFLPALPLTLMTLPHYLLVLPFLAVLVLLFSILALIPILGLIVPGAISAFCTIVGLRCALAARGHGNEPALGALLWSSVIFSLINTLAVIVVSAIAFGIVLLIVGLPGDLTGWQDVLIYLGDNADWAFYLQTVFVVLYFAAMAVPMTATARAGTPGARRPDPVQGFGAGFVSLAIVLGIGSALSLYLGIFGEVWIVLGLMAEWVLVYAMGDELPDLPGITLGFVASVVAIIMASCWYFATAVLAWESRQRRPLEETGATAPVTRISADDLRALRESRMPGNQNPPSV